MTETNQIQKGKAAAEAATEGPWYTEKGKPDPEGFPTRSRVAATSRNQGIYAEAKKGTFLYNDQKFIAQARIAVPALCNALEVAIDEINACKDVFAEEKRWGHVGVCTESLTRIAEILKETE